jgi:hypothetical protein
VNKSIRVELLGIAAILLGVAWSLNNLFAYVFGAIGFVIVAVGCCLKDEK